tara:strand:+ start:746 stop:1675 length:930 start_codon:yes stop_codon:yes gene_type:complete
MNKKLIVEVAEGLGNQIFMYAHAYSLSKELDYALFIDNKSGFSKKKNLLRNHQKYMLGNFNLFGSIADNNMIYDTDFKRFKKKLKLLFDFFSKKKSFIIEKNIRINRKKFAEPFMNIDKTKINNNLYVQGNFENYNYFNKYRSQLCRILIPKKEVIDENNSLINRIKSSNSVSLHIRRDRFSDQVKSKTTKNIKKSDIFTEDIINYINNSIDFINSKVQNPEYFIWSNNHDNIVPLLNKIKAKNYTLVNNDVINDFNLFRYCKHFVVGPSSFHWWGAWLNENPNKICIRPSNINPSNNENFWPNDWISI